MVPPGEVGGYLDVPFPAAGGDKRACRLPTSLAPLSPCMPLPPFPLPSFSFPRMASQKASTVYMTPGFLMAEQDKP